MGGLKVWSLQPVRVFNWLYHHTTDQTSQNRSWKIERYALCALWSENQANLNPRTMKSVALSYSANQLQYWWDFDCRLQIKVPYMLLPLLSEHKVAETDWRYTSVVAGLIKHGRYNLCFWNVHLHPTTLHAPITYWIGLHLLTSAIPIKAFCTFPLVTQLHTIMSCPSYMLGLGLRDGFKPTDLLIYCAVAAATGLPCSIQ